MAVDLRTNLPTFGQWVEDRLWEDDNRMLWVLPRFAHGFLATSEPADFQYRCMDFYPPQYELLYPLGGQKPRDKMAAGQRH